MVLSKNRPVLTDTSEWNRFILQRTDIFPGKHGFLPEGWVSGFDSARHADYWQQQAYPVMLVIRTSDGTIRWMDVSAYLKRESQGGKKPVKQVVFEGEPFTALSLLKWREKVLGPPQASA